MGVFDEERSQWGIPSKHGLLHLRPHVQRNDHRRRTNTWGDCYTVPIRPTWRVTVIMSPADRIFHRLSSSSRGPPPGSTLSPNFRSQPRRVKNFVYRIIKHAVYIFHDRPTEANKKWQIVHRMALNLHWMLGVLATKTINPLIFITGEVHQRLWRAISDPRSDLVNRK